MLTIHHLTTSQSERVLWLCEELGIDYKLVRHERLPDTRLAPPALRALTPMGTAPVMEDGDVVMGESGAIVEYIIHKYGNGRLALKPEHPDYAQYLFWFHFANATLQTLMMRVLTLQRLNVPDDVAYSKAIRERVDRALGSMDARLEKNQWLAGSEFTTADIMSVFSLTTMRVFAPIELAPYPNIVAYLQRAAERPAYRSALAKGDPGFEPPRGHAAASRR
jgi:glutathione S-transferase